tara:strand:+ start:1591 stop:2187 length:597 start_codon:yes stop_codon:yes gene_type:complete
MKLIKKNQLFKSIHESNNLKKKILYDLNEINQIINAISNCIMNGGKILLCGNGGSAADAQHLAAEFLVRLTPKINRKPIAAMTLATDISTITACGNDFSFTKIFSRNLEALGKKNDMLIVITTSGNSKNIIDVLKVSKKMKINSIGFLGNDGGKAKKICDYKIVLPSKNVAHIQENHIFLGHFIFEQVEKNLIYKKYI